MFFTQRAAFYQEMAVRKAADQGQLLVGIALTGGRKSKCIINWALDKFLPEGDVTFRLIHVYPKITAVPTQKGAWIPVAEARQDMVNGYRQETEWKKLRKILPYQKMLKAQMIKADVVILESDDIAMALSLGIARHTIRHLVIGVSSTSLFSMKNLSLVRGEVLSQSISKNAPSFCSVYVIGDGKLRQLRSADSEQNVIPVDNLSNPSSISTNSSSSSSSLNIGRLLKGIPSSPRYGGLDTASESSPSSQNKQFETLPKNAAGTKTLTREAVDLRNHASNINFGNASVWSHSSSSEESGWWVFERSSPGGSFARTQFETPSTLDTPPPRYYLNTPSTGNFAGTPPTGFFKGTPSVETLPTGSYAGTPLSVSHGGTSPGRSYVGTPVVPYAVTPPSISSQGIASDSEASTTNQRSELEKLRIELRHIEKMYELAQNNSIDERFRFPLDQLQEISKERLEEALKLKEEQDKEREYIQKNKPKAVQSEALNTGKKAKRKKPKNKANTNGAQEEENSKNKLNELFTSLAVRYQKFTWEEIIEATSSLSEEFEIGQSALWTVYKCKLHHTTVAVKVLHSKDSATNKQFVQELEALSTIRHPHLLLLLGVVPEENCLVYEYMDHGNLDDRLFQKTGKPPLPWYERFRICCEVAGALAFLHSSKPKPIIHGDLKPANILLDHNLVSKIGDAGLGTMINVEPTNMSIQSTHKESSQVGTICYIDPEYQRTGRVSTKSDIYALGVVILQLLTAKPAVGINYLVEDAIDEGTLTEVLDPEAGEWPENETLELALLGLQCSELRGKDRPDLNKKVLPALERMNEMADSARESALYTHRTTPTHFICPILKTVMEDPYVAADGYTYDRGAIEQWLTTNDKSPFTNQPLPHKFIMPNTTLLEAITQWKSKKQTI